MSNIKIICCDIDGTLVRDDKSLSEENCRWIAKAVNEKGVRFVIVSGRMFSALDYFNKTLGVKGLSSCLNGTFLVDEEGEVLANHTLPYESALKLVKIKEASSAECLYIAENTWYTEAHEGLLYNSKISMYMQDSVIAEPEELVEKTALNKFYFFSKDRSVIEKIYNEIQAVAETGEFSFYLGSSFLEVMKGGITKGTAVDDLIEYYKVDRSQVMALGDDVNDLEMLQKAGVGIAMGNACESVKAIADGITDTNENDGVAKAIRKYVFNLQEA